MKYSLLVFPMTVLSWDEYFMSVAFLSALRSVDPQMKGGACVVNSENRIVGIGYCGYPRGIDSEPSSHDKGLFLCHSVMNAILNKNQHDVRGSRIYTTRYPCSECAKMIIQAGVKRIIFNSGVPIEASQILFDLAGVPVIRLSPGNEKFIPIESQFNLGTLTHARVTG
jgi:dCMP deaminase